MKTEPLKAKGKQSGAALVTAIFAILLVTLIGTALHYMVTISLTVSVNDRDNVEAFYIADAGINHATALISKAGRSKYSAILTGGANPVPGSGDELSVPPSTGLWTSSENIPAGSPSSGGVANFGAGGSGRYWVSVKNDTATGETSTKDLNGILIVTATGVGRNGATATVEVAVKGSTPLPGVLINGKARISGSVKISGTNGSLHANDALVINGGPCAEQYFSTSASVVNPDKLKGAGCNGSGVIRSDQPIIEPPLFNIRNDFYGKTDYILGAHNSQAGKVYTGSGVLISDTNRTGDKWVNGSATWLWDKTKKLWTQTGVSIVNGSFYSEGNIALTGNFGTSLTPARVSFIAEGYIFNQGRQYMTPSFRNYSLIAGTDLRITGKLTEVSIDDLELEGFTYAHHQLDFSGTPILRGSVVAANQADTPSPGGVNLVPLDNGFINISGNPNIISNDINSGSVLTVKNWREVRR